MELPIAGFPGFINDIAEEFIPVFQQKRIFEQFKRVTTGMIVGENCTIAHINGLFIEHTNQSNLNRFVNNSRWSEYHLNKIRIRMINKVETNGVVILDDYMVEKCGHDIYGTDYHFDHSKGRSIFGQNIADCVLSGNGIFPLLSSIYIRKKSKWRNNKKHLTKIELQKRHLTMLVDMGLFFGCVVFDSWYTCKDLIDHIELLEKDWVGQVKSNRLIKIDDKWMSVKDYAETIFPDKSFKTAKVGDDTYLVKAVTVEMKKIGEVRLLISNNSKGNFKFIATNGLNWNEEKILKIYCRRWDIEVWHREGKVDYGLKDCRLRGVEGVSKYLTLSSCADTFLEIASLLSPLLGVLKRKGCTPGLKRRLVLVELVKKLISYVSSIGDKAYRNIVEGILNPYRSTKVKRIEIG